MQVEVRYLPGNENYLNITPKVSNASCRNCFLSTKSLTFLSPFKQLNNIKKGSRFALWSLCTCRFHMQVIIIEQLSTTGAGVICYSLDCYTRFATPLLLQFVTATSSTATMRGAIDHFCYSLPLLHLILLHRFYCYYRHCYRGVALEKSTFDLCPQKNFHPLFLSTSSSVLKKLC